MRRIVKSPQAVADLKELWLEGSQGIGPPHAERFILSIHERFQLLADNPHHRPRSRRPRQPQPPGGAPHSAGSGPRAPVLGSAHEAFERSGLTEEDVAKALAPIS